MDCEQHPQDIHHQPSRIAHSTRRLCHDLPRVDVNEHDGQAGHWPLGVLLSGSWCHASDDSRLMMGTMWVSGVQKALCFLSAELRKKGISMGWRFRRSIGGKYFRLNLGKHGVNGVTFGGRGMPHVTMGRTGTRVGASIPGTGMSYTHRINP
ncbi:DUF4236 domain-containing protein [Bifidobacterium mongoliense]